MSFQSPVEVPGVSNAEFLRLSANARRMAQGLPELDPLEFYGFITPKVLHHTDCPAFNLPFILPSSAFHTASNLPSICLSYCLQSALHTAAVLCLNITRLV